MTHHTLAAPVYRGTGALRQAHRMRGPTQKAHQNLKRQPLKMDLELYGPQFDFIADSSRFTAFIGGIGTGKTTAGIVKCLTHASVPNTLGLVVAPTYGMLRDATLRTFHELMGPAVVHFNKSDMEATLVNGSEILFRSGDQPDRLRGPNIHWAYIDEGSLCPPKTWEITLGRLRADGLAGDCWITATPKGRNWLWEVLPQLSIYQGKTRDNPYLNREYVASLERAYTGDFARQELEGSFIKFEGVIYEEYDYDFHVFQRPLTDFVEFIAGGDEGYTNPSVILVIGIDTDGNPHLVDEYYEFKKRHSEVGDAAERFQRVYGISTFYFDPSASGLIAELESRDLTVNKADHKVKDGIQTVKRYLQPREDLPTRPMLGLDPRCVWTNSEFNSYIWAENKLGKKDEPQKASDHAMDALRYALHTHFGGLIGQLMY